MLSASACMFKLHRLSVIFFFVLNSFIHEDAHVKIIISSESCFRVATRICIKCGALLSMIYLNSDWDVEAVANEPWFFLAETWNVKKALPLAIDWKRKKENLVQINAPGVFDLPRNCLTEMLFQIIGKIMSSENLCKWRVNQFDIDNMQSCYFSFLIIVILIEL